MRFYKNISLFCFLALVFWHIINLIISRKNTATFHLYSILGLMGSCLTLLAKSLSCLTKLMMFKAISEEVSCGESCTKQLPRVVSSIALKDNSMGQSFFPLKHLRKGLLSPGIGRRETAHPDPGLIITSHRCQSPMHILLLVPVKFEKSPRDYAPCLCLTKFSRARFISKESYLNFLLELELFNLSFHQFRTPHHGK